MRDFLSAPLRVDLNLTNRCHLNCKYCYASANEAVNISKELTVDELDKLFAEFQKIGVFRVQLAGGEPLLRNDFLEILSITKKYDFSLSLNTTGYFLTEEICIELSKCNFELITVSLEANNAELHDKIKGGKSFEKAIEALKLLKKHNLKTAIGLTLNSYNIDHVFDTIDLVRPIGINIVGIQVLCPAGRLSKNMDFIPERKRYVRFVNDLIDYQNTNKSPKINLNVTNEGPVFWEYYYPLKKLHKLNLLKDIWGQNTKNRSDISCVAGISVCSIGEDGSVYPCEMFVSDPEMSAGNIKKDEFNNIWKSSKLFKEFRKLSRESLTGPCSTCKNKWCGGGCRAAAYYDSNKINSSDTHCFYAQENEK